MAKNVKTWNLIHINEKGKKKAYKKEERHLTKTEHEVLYQEFAKTWDNTTTYTKNRFIAWINTEFAKLANK